MKLITNLLDRRSLRFVGVAIFCHVCASVAFAAEKTSPFTISTQVTELLESYRFDCHDGESKKGDVRLDNLETLA